MKNIESDKWTATEVVSAYIRQAIDAHERTNCLTESEYSNVSGNMMLITFTTISTFRRSTERGRGAGC